MVRTLLAASLIALALAPAHAQGTPRDLSVEPGAAVSVTPIQSGDLRVSVTLDRANSTYARGESVRIFAQTTQDAYITVLSYGASGAVTQLFPNRINGDNFVHANTSVEIPGPGARVTVTGETGDELIKVIATRQPLAVIPERDLVSSGRSFFSVSGGVRTATRDLEVAAANTAPDQKIAVANKTIRTVPAYQPAYAPAYGDTVIIVPGAASGQWTYPLPPARY
jgi:hypothetical protein